MTKSELRKLRKKLPKDYRSRIAEKTGLSSDYVYRVLIGERQNEKIIDAAIVLAEKHQAVLESRKEAVKKL